MDAGRLVLYDLVEVAGKDVHHFGDVVGIFHRVK
jgi:hypothetical protein